MRRPLLLALVLLAAVPALAGADYTNPVIPGDGPDPTLLQAADGYFYASATVSAWAPLFPILRSRDLVNWEQVGGALRDAPPWAAGRFWAPELAAAPAGHPGFILYYSASQQRGRACVGVATSPTVPGPYRDRGRAVCPPGGAIDASPVTDEQGQPWLAWKRLGAGNGIYLQRLRPDGLKVIGQPIRAILPDESWEKGVTEGPTFLRRPGGWLMLYSGGTCCRPPCSYAEGYATAPALQGPWTKAAAPFLTGSDAFKCPGHGTAVDLGVRGVWLLHHGYRPDDVLDLRRVGLLTPLAFGADGLPQSTTAAGAGTSPFGDAQVPHTPSWSDDFDGNALAPAWQWLFDRAPATRVADGSLHVGCSAPSASPAFVARQAVADRLAAIATVRRSGGAIPFLAVHDHDGTLRGVAWTPTGAHAIRITRGGRVTMGPATRVARTAPSLDLLVSAVPGGQVGLQVRAPGQPLAPVIGRPAVRGAGATRVALGCFGRGEARFGRIRMQALG